MGFLKKFGIILGFSLLILFITSYKSKYNIEDIFVEGIIDKYKFDGDKMSLEVIGLERIVCNYYFDDIDEKNYYLNNIKYGQKVYLNGTMAFPNENSNFGLFNYRKYLLGKKIHYVFNAESIDIDNNKNILYSFKNYLVNRIDKISSPYLYAFILGDTSFIDDDIKESYQVNGISHLLAISGMHITFLFNGLYNLLNKIKRNRLNIVIVSFFLFIYLFLVSFSPSSVRAGIMFLVGKVKKIKSYYLLLIIFFIFLFYNPYFIYNTGFLLSFIVTFYILFFQDLIEGNYFKRLFLTSFISFIASAPIIIYSYNSINLFSVFLNLLFVPFVTFIVFPLSFVSLFFGSNIIYSFFTNIMEKMSLFFYSFSFNIILRDIGPFLLIYVIVGLFALLKLKRKKYSFCLLFFIVIFIHTHLFNFYPVVTFLDVGQGDCILIEFPFNKGNILIDTGGKVYFDEWREKSYSISSSIIIPYLKKRGIKKIDFLIISHGDFDHMGEASKLIKSFTVERVIFNVGTFNELELSLIENLRKNKIPYYNNYNNIKIENFDLYFLKTSLYDNENDNSNIIYSKFYDYKFLFMGDAGSIVESSLIEKYNLNNIDVLKVGHHGSKTSSSKIFINSINPYYSIISVGKNNMYGHPNDVVLDNLKSSKIYRTDQNGGIMFKIKKDKLELKKCLNN